jgi:hypothetical protein
LLSVSLCVFRAASFIKVIVLVTAGNPILVGF